MTNIIELNIFQFSLIYVLLTIVLFIMKRCRINKTKLLIIASSRMTIQLITIGFLLTYIFAYPHPLYTILFLVAMISFAVWQTLSKYKNLNKQFKLIIGSSIAGSGLFVIFYFTVIVLRNDFFDTQYTIPIAGMIIGNAMTGVSLGLKSFTESLKNQQQKLETLLNLGVSPKKILLPFANNAIDSALLPTINSFLGMGIVFMPGMMTGQILSGTPPMIAIIYQISIMIAILTSVCLTVFFSIHFGYQTLYNEHNQITY